MNLISWLGVFYLNVEILGQDFALTSLSLSLSEFSSLCVTLDVGITKNYFGQVRIARIFNTYGPRMGIDDGRVVSNFVAQVSIYNWFKIFLIALVDFLLLITAVNNTCI